MTQSIPSSMHAVQVDEPNGRIKVREIPVPHPQAGQVLIRMAAAPINPSDIASLYGFSYSSGRTYPFTPGGEGSGVVIDAGEGLMPRLFTRCRVACSPLGTGGGTWAEYMVTSAGLCAPLNKNVSLEQGAMMLVNPMTALAFFDITISGKHHAIVSTVAASALGGMILRLGKRYSIPVIHIVRRQEQVDRVRTLGGEYVLNSSDVDFVDQLREMTHKLQATLFLDAIGGSMTQQLAEAAPVGSTILLYSRMSNQNSVIDASIALRKDLHFNGWFLPYWLRKKNYFQKFQFSRHVQSLLATDLHSPIHKRFPLAEAQKGLETYMNSMSAGKVILVADPSEVTLDG